MQAVSSASSISSISRSTSIDSVRSAGGGETMIDDRFQSPLAQSESCIYDSPPLAQSESYIISTHPQRVSADIRNEFPGLNIPDIPAALALRRKLLNMLCCGRPHACLE